MHQRLLPTVSARRSDMLPAQTYPQALQSQFGLLFVQNLNCSWISTSNCGKDSGLNSFSLLDILVYKREHRENTGQEQYQNADMHDVSYSVLFNPPHHE